MSDLDALLAGIVSNPHDGLRWLVLADWLDDHGQPERAELTRLHRELLRTCSEPDKYPERPAIHERIMELMRAGAIPCVPRMTLQLPGAVELPMAFIPPGTFLMGSQESEVGRELDELIHLVRLTKGFFLGISQVTQAQWVAVMGENPSVFLGDTLPVETVNSYDVQAFCVKVMEMTGLQIRLPTEAEWEYAARSGTTTPFYWGNQLNGREASCDSRYPYGTEATWPYLMKTTPVGSYSSISPHPWGLLDMLGNVCDWCTDLYDDEYYSKSSTDDPVGPESGSHFAFRGSILEGYAHNLRVARGGNWAIKAGGCRAAFRFDFEPEYLSGITGFRVVHAPTYQ